MNFNWFRSGVSNSNISNGPVLKKCKWPRRPHKTQTIVCGPHFCVNQKKRILGYFLFSHLKVVEGCIRPAKCLFETPVLDCLQLCKLFLGPTSFNRYLVNRLKVPANSFSPLREFCCGFNEATCGLKCSEMISNGFW